MWHENQGPLPKEYLKKLYPRLGEMCEYLHQNAYTYAQTAGELTEEWAIRLGLTPDIAIGVGAIGAHTGTIGASVAPGVFVSIVGTSICDIMVSPEESLRNPYIQDISGRVNGSVLPGYIGTEAGQAAFGNIFAWFKSIVSWTFSAASNKNEAESMKRQILTRLTQEVAKIKPHAAELVAFDWTDGRRTPNVDQDLKGTITGITLRTSVPEIYRTLAEFTASGLKRIIEHIREQGPDIKSINVAGGINKKPPFVMQTLSDVIEMPTEITKSENACAFGSAMLAAVVSGIYPAIGETEKHMMSRVENEYTPNLRLKSIYDQSYQKYLELDHAAKQLI